MNDTVAAVPQYQVRRIKSELSRFSSPLATRGPVFWQLIMPRNAARRGLVTVLQTYAIAVSFDILCAIFVRDVVLASASSALPAKLEDAAAFAGATFMPHASHHFAVAGFDKTLSGSDLTASADAVNAKGAEKQPVSEAPHGTENSEAAFDAGASRLPADAFFGVPWAVVGSVLRAYLLALEHELRVALTKLSPARWRAASGAALSSEPSPQPLARASPQLLPERGALSSPNYPFEKPASKPSAHPEAVGQAGAGLDDLVESAAQVWQGFLALAHADNYVSAVVPSLEQTVQRKSAPSSAQQHGDISAVVSGHVLVGRVKKTVQQIVNDIPTLATVQQLLNDFTRRLKYFLQGEQELRERIACLTAPDYPSGKDAEGLPERLPADDRCAGFEMPQNKDDRRALRLALEKQLNDVHRVAKDAAQLLFSVLFTAELDGPFESHNTSAWLYQQSPLAALAWPLLHQTQGSFFMGPLQSAPVPDLDLKEEVRQARRPSSRSQPGPAASPGVAPRSLSSTPALRGQTLFAKDLQSRRGYSPRRQSSSSMLYGAQHAYHCFRRPTEPAASDVMQCQCMMPSEVVPETAILEPLTCTKTRRATLPRFPVSLVEQAVECYPTTTEPLYLPPPIHAAPRPVDFFAAPRIPVSGVPAPVPEVPIQCSCLRSRVELECRRSPLQQYALSPAREAVKVVPEVIEHRPVEQVLPTVGCELVPLPRPEYHVFPEPAPETVLVPCECIEHGVQVPEAFVQRMEPEVHPADAREPVLIPLDCIMRSSQPDRVPCQCFARAPTEVLACSRPHPDYGSYVECFCPADHHLQPGPAAASPYSVPE